MRGRRLTHSEVKDVRTAQMAQQGNRCDLCGLPGVSKDPVLDHCHTTGAVRGTLHRSCNALLGKVENNHARFGVRVENLPAFLHGAAKYLQKHRTNITGLIHPTHKTEEEKRALRNKRARDKRAKARKKP